MINIIVLGLVIVAVAFAIRHLMKEKKQGKCISCPYAGTCTKKSCNNEMD